MHHVWHHISILKINIFGGKKIKYVKKWQRKAAGMPSETKQFKQPETTLIRRFLWYTLNPETLREGASFTKPIVVITVT